MSKRAKLDHEAGGGHEGAPCAAPDRGKVATLAIHGGDQRDRGHGAIFPPITTATSFVQPNIHETQSDLNFCYSRCGNPTRYAYETALAALEGGSYCTATASGMAATSLALELLEKDSHVIVMRGVYGGTHRLFEKVRRHTMGIDFTYMDLNDSAELGSVLLRHPNTRMIWIETPTNPLLELVDIERVLDNPELRARSQGADGGSRCSDRAKAPLAGSGIIVAVDNTFATAWNQRPLLMGCDLVMVSASKYIGGHSDMTGGALITNNDSLKERLQFLKTCVGGVASPFEAYLALRGMKTLDVRMERQCRNAQAVAEFLHGELAAGAEKSRVSEVHYPGLASHPQHSLCRRQMRAGGAVVTIRLRESPSTEENLATMRAFFSRLRIWVLAESLGGVESMINHSATMSHNSMTKDERADIGIHDTTLRLSVGCEDADDLIQDLHQALGECA